MMRAHRLPGRPMLSTAPRKPPPKIAPAKLAAKARVEAAKDLKAQQRQQCSATVREHLETIAEAHRKRRAGPSALDPVTSEQTPMKRHRGKSNSNVMSLLQVSALAVLSHPFGSELASWDKGVAVD
jgi:hypothetical protein